MVRFSTDTSRTSKKRALDQPSSNQDAAIPTPTVWAKRRRLPASPVVGGDGGRKKLELVLNSLKILASSSLNFNLEETAVSSVDGERHRPPRKHHHDSGGDKHLPVTSPPPPLDWNHNVRDASHP